MIPQGAAVVNTQYFTNMTDRVNGAGSCAQLQAITTELLLSLKAETDAIAAQLALLGPLAALLDPPTSPSDVIDWITSLINNVLKPLYAPFANYELQVAARTTAIAALIAAITSKASSFPSCDITFPS
jgi:hypothetical protein